LPELRLTSTVRTVTHFLDHASTSPLRPAARAALLDALDANVGGDPGRIYTRALAARVALEDARNRIAAAFGTRGRSVVLTSGATESIVSAVWGAARRAGSRSHQVVPAVEHSAVRTAAAQMGDVTTVGCDAAGRVDVDALMAAVKPDTAVVHLQWGNHEVGTTQPIAELVERCRNSDVLVHVDAAQAAGHVAIDFDTLGADLMSVSAHKMGGPAGVGALLIRRGLRIDPLITGGDQERARRAGLENVVGALAWAAACEELVATLDESTTREAAHCARIAAACRAVDGVTVYGHSDHRLPHIVCVGIEGIEPQAVLLGLDQRGIAAHSGSACASEDLAPSPVLEAMGVDAHRSLRLSVGWNTTDADIDAFDAAFAVVIQRLRDLR
jgi:cysteine desulfurase